MANEFSTAELEAYLEEALPPEGMCRVETALRDQPELAQSLAEVAGRIDAGMHSIGAIWRRHRLSCPTREQLGSSLLNILDTELMGYVKFHVEVVQCRYCAASLADLRQIHEAAETSDSAARRAKYFQSSAGFLIEEDA